MDFEPDLDGDEQGNSILPKTFDAREIVSITLPTGLTVSCGSNSSSFDHLVDQAVGIIKFLSEEQKTKTFTGVS